MSKPEYWDGHIPWISPKDMKSDYLIDSMDKVTELGVLNSSANIIPEGSVMIVGRSGILKRIIPVAINGVQCTVNQDMKVIIPYLKGSEKYLHLLIRGLQSIILKRYVKYGMTVHSLKYSEFELMPVPWPSLYEQNVILAKVNQLIALCDQMEQQIQSSQRHSGQLMESLVRGGVKNVL